MTDVTNTLRTDVTNTLKDAAYVTVGFGVLGFQKAQVRRVELMKQLETQRKLLETQVTEAGKSLADVTSGASKSIEEQVSIATKAFAGLAKDLDARLLPVRDQIEVRLGALEDHLPEQARDLVKQARATAVQTQEQVRSRLGLTNTTV